MKHFVLTVAAITGVFGILAPDLHAGPIVNQTYSGSFPASITGTLPSQDTALLESFTLPSTSNLTVFTTSYATGGFQPNFMLYDSLGRYVTTGITSGSSPVAQKDPTTGLALDAYLTAPNLPAGMYTLTITDFLLNQSLTATNLSDGFTVNYGSGTTFVDEMGNMRNGTFAVTISGPGAAAVPEPATMWMVAPFLGALALRTRRRMSQAKK